MPRPILSSYGRAALLPYASQAVGRIGMPRIRWEKGGAWNILGYKESRKTVIFHKSAGFTYRRQILLMKYCLDG